MTRRALPLLPDALPLYATREQIVGSIAVTAAGQKAARYLFAMRGFPPPSPFMAGLYYTPAVLAFIEKFEAKSPTANEGTISWDQTSRRRG